VTNRGEDELQTPMENDVPCFEDALAELETIVHELEEGELGLAESLERYEQGVKHLKHCYALLKDAEQKIELLTGVSDEGRPLTEPFDNQAASLGESAGRKRSRRGKSPPTPSVADDEGDSADIDD
jgi:exodeoxyribonuclease VII small subunit